MNANDRYDACMRLAEFWSARADTRRQYEWRIVLGFYAFMILVVTYLPRDTYTKAYVTIGIAAYIILFLRGNWVASTKDKEQAWYFVGAAERILSDETYKVERRPATFKLLSGHRRWIGAFFDWNTRFQILIAGMFLIVFYLLPQLAKLPLGGQAP